MDQRLAEASCDVMFRCKPSGEITYVSRSSLRILGYRPDELVGRSAEMLLHLEDRNRTVALFNKVLSGEAVIDQRDFEHRMVGKTGGEVWVESRPIIRRDQVTGQIVEVIDFCRDITSRKLSEIVLSERERHFELLTEGSRDLVTRFSRDGTINYVSPACLPILGYAPGELVGRRMIDFIHPDDRRQVRRLMVRASRGEEAAGLRFEYRAVRRSGGVRTLEASLSAVWNDDRSTVLEFFDVSRDITDRKIAEAAMRSALDSATMERTLAEVDQQRFQMLAAASRDITLQYDASGEILYVSPACQQLGYDPNALPGCNLASMIHPDDHGLAAESMRRLFSSDPEAGGARTELRVMKADGSGFVWLESVPAVVRGSEGEPLCVITSLRDVTDRHALEENLVAAKVEAEAAAAAKGQFLANMSHELRTPLTSVIGFAQLIQGEPGLPDNVLRAVERISAGGKALLSTINDVLDFSRIEAGEVPINRAPTALDAVLSEALEMLRMTAEDKGLGIRLEAAADLPAAAMVDSDRLRQVLTNLLGNAVKFTETGEVVVAATYDLPNSALMVRVTDTGVGVPAEALGQLFQRFSQVDASVSRRYGGSGLGLAISKGLVEAMGGRIGVESREGAGSTFWFEIPAPACAAGEGAADASLALPPGVRILMVDDNTENREVVGAMLQGLEADVHFATNGLEGVEAAMLLPYDAILMDKRMPGLDGVAATRRIRSSLGPNQHAPILLCTADETVLSGEATSLFDGIILKPLSLRKLVGGLLAVMDSLPQLLDDQAEAG